jgi:hypothetical protein
VGAGAGASAQEASTPPPATVSLKLHDVDTAMDTVTCLDHYLDNVMADVPELALCLHQKGFVRGYKLVATDDLPSMMVGGDGGGGGGGGGGGEGQGAGAGAAVGAGGGGGGGGGSGGGAGGKTTTTAATTSFDPAHVDMNATMLLRFLQVRGPTHSPPHLPRSLPSLTRLAPCRRVLTAALAACCRRTAVKRAPPTGCTAPRGATW